MKRARGESVLILGGSGYVGTRAAETLRRWHPDLPITIGGRDLVKAEAVAHRLGAASAARIDLGRDDLGLPESARFGAVVMFVKDEQHGALRWAQGA